MNFLIFISIKFFILVFVCKQIYGFRMKCGTVFIYTGTAHDMLFWLLKSARFTVNEPSHYKALKQRIMTFK